MMFDGPRVEPKPSRRDEFANSFMEDCERIQRAINWLARQPNVPRAAAILKLATDELEELMVKALEYPNASIEDVARAVEHGCDPSDLPRW